MLEFTIKSSCSLKKLKAKRFPIFYSRGEASRFESFAASIPRKGDSLYNSIQTKVCTH